MIKTYKLAVIGEYGNRKAFGPYMTLSQAEKYQADMVAGGFPCVVLNMAEGFDPTLVKKPKVWTRFTLLAH